jgi:hypothetical protein
MAAPILVLAGMAAVTAVVSSTKPPAWLAGVPALVLSVAAAVLVVLGLWWAEPWAARRQAQAGAERSAIEQLRRHLGRRERLPRLGEPAAAALALRVHPAIARRALTAPVARADPTAHRRWRVYRGRQGRDRVNRADSDLPMFVEREISPALREWMGTAAGSGGFLLLVGASSVGKTRLLYEAAREVLGSFAVLAPDLGDGDLVNKLADATFPLPPLIIWLDELQRFLTGPYLTPGSTAILPGAVSRLLSSPSPIVILATLWPEYGEHLRDTVAEERTGRPIPRYQASVDILDERRVHEVALSTFTITERRAAARLAADDSRFAEALADRDYNVTEVLAGARELVRRYERATADQKAVLHAAVDARRLGIQAPLAGELLCDAARGYLTGARPDDEWFGPVLEELTSASRATAPLIPIHDAAHRVVVGYTVADYLLQRLTAARRTVDPPAVTRAALVTHPHRRDDMSRLADSMQRHRWYADAEQVLHRLATTDDPDGPSRLARFLVEQDRDIEAIDMLRACVDAGRPHAAWTHAILLARHGRVSELQTRARDGDRAAAYRLVGVLTGEGRIEEAVSVLRRQADTGDGCAANRLTRFLFEQGRTDQAVEYLHRQIGNGVTSALDQLFGYLVGQDRLDEAITLLRDRADTGDHYARHQLIEALVSNDRVDELHNRADAGDRYAARRLRDLMNEATTRHAAQDHQMAGATPQPTNDGSPVG